MTYSKARFSCLMSYRLFGYLRTKSVRQTLPRQAMSKHHDQHQTEIIPLLGAINGVVDCFSLYDINSSDWTVKNCSAVLNDLIKTFP